MSFRGNQNQNRSRNYGGGNMQGGVGGNRMANLSPWGVPNNAGNYGNSGGNMRGQGGAGGQGMNAQAINLANNLLSNLFRNQNPPSLLDLPRGGGGGGAGGSGGMGNRNRGAGHMMNRGGGNRQNNRRGGQNNFVNRGPPGGNKPHQHQHQKQPMGGGIRKQNSFDRAKKVLAKTNNKNNKRDAQSLDDSQHEGAKESPYANVPNDLFYCHLCKKHMWDALSFENHIKGRTHLMVREGIEESYRLKANMIRQEAKIAEQLKSIELDRLKRMGKSNQRAPEYCTMCDLHFHGHITGHRKSEDHLQLKKFLHPKCNECNEEFSTRIDYDSHLLSAEHLLKAAEKNTKVGERKRNTLIILTADDELKDIRQQQRRRKKTGNADEKPVKKEGEAEEGEGENAAEGGEVKQEPHDQTEADGEAKEAGADETKDDEELNETNEEVEAAPNDPEDCILDYAENDEIPVEVDTRLPKYNSQRAVGLSLIRKLECYECVLCAKFLDTENTAEVHSRTGGHHRNFLKFINEKASDAKIAQKRAAAALEFNERKKRRLEDNKETAKNGTEIKVENESGEGGAEEQTTDGDNLYNPAEVTGDDDDVEMAETEQQEDEQNENEAQEEAEDQEEEEEFVEEKQAETKVEPEPEPKPEPIPEPVVKPEVKPAVVPKTTPVKPAAAVAAPAAANTTPTAAATTPVTSTPAAAANNNSTPEQTTPARKNTAIRGGGSGGRGNPRGRGRGRYNRY